MAQPWPFAFSSLNNDFDTLLYNATGESQLANSITVSESSRFMFSNDIVQDDAISPSISLSQAWQSDKSKSAANWPPSFLFPPNIIQLPLLDSCPLSSFPLQPSECTPSIGLHDLPPPSSPLGTATFQDSLSLPNDIEFQDWSYQQNPTPQLSPSSWTPGSLAQIHLFSNSSKLSHYHHRIATDHAQHLTHLVRGSQLIGAMHPGPRSLARSLSKSVLQTQSLGRPDPTQPAPHDSNGLSIQQRRRMTQLLETHSSSNPPSYFTRKRHLSAPGSCLPTFDPSPESFPSQTLRSTHLEKAHSYPGDQRATQPTWTTNRLDQSETTQTDEPRSAASFGNSCQPQPQQDDPKLQNGPKLRHDLGFQGQEWYQAVLAHSQDLVFVLSLKGTVLYVSPSIQTILGYTEEEVVGRRLIDFCHPADVAPFCRELKESISLSNLEESHLPEGESAGQQHGRVDLVMRMSLKSGGYCLIETTGQLSINPPKHRKVVVCSGRPRAIPMLPWDHVRADLINHQPSAWLKCSHNGIFLGHAGPIHDILGIENVSLIGRHIRDLPMAVANSCDFLEALCSGRTISVQDHVDSDRHQRAPVKLTVYPWTSEGRSNSVSFVHVQQYTCATGASGANLNHLPLWNSDRIPNTNNNKGLRKRKANVMDPSCQEMESPPLGAFSAESGSGGKAGAEGDGFDSQHDSTMGQGKGVLSGLVSDPNCGATRIMTQGDAESSVFAELTEFHNGSWLIEMQKLQNANKRLRHELLALQKRPTKSRGDGRRYTSGDLISIHS